MVDFDSHDNPHLDVETIVLPCEKDDTDIVFTIKEAVKRGFDDFLLICVVDARLDLCPFSSVFPKRKVVDLNSSMRAKARQKPSL